MEERKFVPCCLILLLFFWLALFNAGWLISYQVPVNCWAGSSCKISLPVVQMWSSHFYLAIIVWESSVANSCIGHWHEIGFGLLRLSLFISYWLLGFVFASLLEIWKELLMHWGRLNDLTSSSSQLLDGHLLQDFTSSPNLVITFLLGNIVWESTVANNCIGHWHKTGLRTVKGHPSSSHIGCLDLCLHHYWKFG